MHYIYLFRPLVLKRGRDSYFNPFQLEIHYQDPFESYLEATYLEADLQVSITKFCESIEINQVLIGFNNRVHHPI